MKCSIPEISWHNREPVLSIDIQISTPECGFYRLASGGSDNLVLIWKLTVQENGKIDISPLSELTRHQRTVNVVKWSTNGELLASGDDDAHIIIWQLKTDNIPSLDEQEDQYEERWNVYKILRGHKDDVYDLSWSPNSEMLLSGSVDNTAIVWNVAKGKSDQIITDHKGFVQGVAWDPKNQYLATMASDRCCRIFNQSNNRVKHRIHKGLLQLPESHELHNIEVRYFHDDTFKSYFRRLTFTPDGNLLLIPSGAVDTDEKKHALYGTFVFTLNSLESPSCVFPSGNQCSIAVKCSPVMYELHTDGPTPVIDLPYRMVIAVATDSDLILYDTQQLAPCAFLKNIHYTRLTDLTWSSDGLVLAASSTDGFVTLIKFEDGELGVPYIKEESDVEESLLQDSIIEEQQEEIVEVSKPATFLKQWAMQPKKQKDDNGMEVAINNENDELKPSKNIIDLTKSAPKRITPTLLTKEIKSISKLEVLLEHKPQIVEKEVTPVKKAKKRIQPTKIGEVSKPVRKDNELQHTEVTNALSTSIECSKKQKIESSEITESFEEDKVVDLTMEDEKEPTTLVETTKVTPKHSGKKGASIKKLISPHNTLLNYLKPVSGTKSNKKLLESGVRTEQCLQPLKLKFSDKEDTISTHKVKTSNLFKIKSNTSTGDHKPTYIEDSCEAPEDFVLEISDSDENTSESINRESFETDRIHKTDSKDKNIIVPVKQSRRVPLITLSSPKNKLRKTVD